MQLTIFALIALQLIQGVPIIDGGLDVDVTTLLDSDRYNDIADQARVLIQPEHLLDGKKPKGQKIPSVAVDAGGNGHGHGNGDGNGNGNGDGQGNGNGDGSGNGHEGTSDQYNNEYNYFHRA